MPALKKKQGSTPSVSSKSNGTPLKGVPSLEKEESAITMEEPKEIIYPKVQSIVCDGKDAITVSQAKDLLGWETEKEFAARGVSESGIEGAKEEDFGYGEEKDNYLLKDEEGNKVRCWNNSRNRPFSEPWARQLAQDILNRNFTGPTTMPGETVNGESVIISRTGQVLSAQHRLIGLVLAGQIWNGQKQGMHWHTKWATEPIIESVVVTGVSDSPQVLRTLDNVKPRTLADVFYTSEIFDNLKGTEKKECSRMLSKAVEFLWGRTKPSDASFSKYQTHTESRTFVDRHERLLKCLKHIFDQNKERAISKLHLSPGQCAGMLYLMGSSTSDGDAYWDKYRGDKEPTEELLSWGNWEKALDFWVHLVKNRLPSVNKAIAYLLKGSDADSVSMGGRQSEKCTVLAKAWAIYLENGEVPSEDALVPLQYQVDDKGMYHLIEEVDFGGIDLGDSSVKEPEPEISEEEVEKAKEEARKAKTESMKEKLLSAKAKKEEKEGKKAEGKPKTPPAMSHKEVLAEQTRKAKEADEQLAKAKAAPKPTPKSRGPKGIGVKKLMPGNAKK
jgi:hypothetical protein